MCKYNVHPIWILLFAKDIHFMSIEHTIEAGSMTSIKIIFERLSNVQYSWM